MDENIFKLDGVSYCYFNKIKAVENISITIKKSESIAILGANGSGKSTLLKIFDGLYFPKIGKVEAFGKILNEKTLRDKEFNRFFRKNVGFVFQDPDAQLFLPTVRDEIAFAPIQLGYSEEETSKLVEKAAKELNLEKLLDKYPFKLSEGEKKKVALSSIYTLNPNVWLLDEPILSLDPKTQWWIVDFIKQLKNNKKTIIVATHNIGFAKLIADKCCILQDDHKMAIFDETDYVLKQKELLEKANLIHPAGIIA